MYIYISNMETDVNEPFITFYTKYLDIIIFLLTFNFIDYIEYNCNKWNILSYTKFFQPHSIASVDKFNKSWIYFIYSVWPCAMKINGTANVNFYWYMDHQNDSICITFSNYYLSNEHKYKCNLSSTNIERHKDIKNSLKIPNIGYSEKVVIRRTDNSKEKMDNKNCTKINQSLWLRLPQLYMAFLVFFFKNVL